MILTNDWIVCKLHKAIAFLALICAGTFTGSLTDFSSSTSTLEIYMPSQTITKYMYIIAHGSSMSFIS